MNENLLQNQQASKQEELMLKTVEATVEDWRDLKEIRIEAIENDPKAFDLEPEEVEQEKNKKDKEWKADLLDKNRFTVLSRYDSRTVGLTWAINRGQGVWAIRGVYVSPELRKIVTGDNTVSNEIIQKVLNGIKKRGGTLARLWVLIERKNSISLYEKFNFKKVDRARVLSLFGEDPPLVLKLSEWQMMVKDLTKEQEKK